MEDQENKRMDEGWHKSKQILNKYTAKKGEYPVKNSRNVFFPATVFAVCGLILGLQAEGPCEDSNKQIVAVAQKIKNEAKPFNINIWTGDKKDTYEIGEKLSLFFTTDHDCYLYLLNVGTTGKAHVLFPNKWHKSNKAEKGKTYMIPPKKSKFVFKIRGPEGTDYIKAIATTKPWKFLARTEKKEEVDFEELDDPVSEFKEIGVELAKRDKKNWAEAEISLKVVKAVAEFK